MTVVQKYQQKVKQSKTIHFIQFLVCVCILFKVKFNIRILTLKLSFRIVTWIQIAWAYQWMDLSLLFIFCDCGDIFTECILIL